MQIEKYDVIVVGTGAAGLFAALSMPKQYRILMITNDKIENSDSYLAQGGISALLNDEDYETYFEDTMKAGKYENNKESVHIMIEESKEIIKNLVSYGVEFDKNQDGEISYTREGAHSTYRILHHKDQTGKEITSKLIQRVREQDNITVREFETMIDIFEEDNDCNGIVVRTVDENLKLYLAKTTILATGGLGGLFKSSTNFRHIKGDSFAIALQHNIQLENINYIQVHPTVLFTEDIGRRFLISESVRGEGAILLNENKMRFVDELLPRDVVTEAIFKEMKRFNTEYVYLSIVGMDEANIKFRFPNIYAKCLEYGYNMGTDHIPVTPAIHYLMGGIKAGVNGQTSMSNLYAVGETACNGVHGANRLASNSLLESLVFAKRAADVIKADYANQCFKEDYDLQILEKKYENADLFEKTSHELLLKEIKNNNITFYNKWCKE